MKSIVKLISLWLILQLFFFDSNSPNIGFRPDRLIFLIIVTIFIINIFRKKIKLVQLSRIEIYMITFTLVCTISLIISEANLDMSHGKNKWVNALFNISYFPFITYFITKNIRYSEEGIKFLIIVLCYMGMYLSLTGMFEHFRVDALVWPKHILDPTKGIQFGRVRGPFLDSVSMGRMMVITFLCTVLMATQNRNIGKIVFYGFSLITVGSIYFTYTRGPWLGFFAALILLTLFRTKMRRPVMLILISLLFVVMTGIGAKLSLFEGTLFSKRQDTVDDRIVSYTTALRMASANPILGVGFGKFGSEWDNYFIKVKDIPFSEFDGSHNTFLGILAETGLIGLILYLAIFYYLLKMCLNIYKKIDEAKTFEKNLVVIALAAAAMYISTGFVSDLRWNLLQNNLMFLFFGIISSLAARYEQKRQQQ